MASWSALSCPVPSSAMMYSWVARSALCYVRSVHTLTTSPALSPRFSARPRVPMTV